MNFCEHASMPWDTLHTREVENEWRDQQEAFRELCRRPWSRMNVLLTLVEKGADVKTLRERYNVIAARHKWTSMPEHEAETVHLMCKKILTGTLCEPGEIERNEDARMKNGCIAWKRALRVVRVVRMRAEGRAWTEIIAALGSTQSVVQNDFYQFVNGQINGVYGDYETVPWDEWLEKHGASALKGLRNK